MEINMQRQCKKCGADFESKTSRHVYCTYECAPDLSKYDAVAKEKRAKTQKLRKQAMARDLIRKGKKEKHCTICDETKNIVEFCRNGGDQIVCNECIIRFKGEVPDEKIGTLLRRSIGKGVAFDFTKDDERFMLNFFNGRCAICERPLRDLFKDHTYAIDHWIPISDDGPKNPGSIPGNLIPLCHGIDGCNNKKGNNDPEAWVFREHPKKRAERIIERINRYFDSVKR